MINDKDSDSELFRRALDEVKPLDKRARVTAARDSAKSSEKSRRAVAVDARKFAARRAAVAETAEERAAAQGEYCSDDYIERVEPQQILSFQRGGVQTGVFRKLRLGQYHIEGRLDLHRKTVAEAEREVGVFLAEARQHGARTVMILHGKGGSNTADPAKIKRHVAHWLKQDVHVMAYHSATPRHGGSGALYVLLKKNAAAVARNRERHGGRS